MRKKLGKVLQVQKIVVPLQPQSREKASHAWGHGFESRTHRNKHPILHTRM